MGEISNKKRLKVTSDTRPCLPRHIKLRHDPRRGRWVILAPERVFDPDDIAVDVLKLCDGRNTIQDISKQLAKNYQAPAKEICTDIEVLLQELADKGVIIS